MVSIIVPVYKAELYIRRCIDSIISQYYKNWELILVDDGSPDNSGKICDEYAEFDHRIKVIHKSNGGVSIARNVGLDYACGEWITFVDADDWIEPSYLETLLHYKGDIIACGCKCTSGMEYALPSKKFFFEDVKENIVTIMNANPFFAPWGKIIRSEIIRKYKIKFDIKLRLGEDTCFCWDLLFFSEKFVYISDLLYNYEGDITDHSKYHLSWCEVSDLALALNNRFNNLSKRANVKIPLAKSFCLSKLATVDNLLVEHTDLECYELYKKLFPNDSEKDYLENIGANLVERAFKKSIKEKSICSNNFVKIPLSFYWNIGLRPFLFSLLIKLSR